MAVWLAAALCAAWWMSPSRVPPAGLEAERLRAQGQAQDPDALADAARRASTVAPHDGVGLAHGLAAAGQRRAWAWSRAGAVRDAERDYAALAAAGDLDDESRVRYAWMLNEQRRHREAWQVAAPLPVRAAHLELLAFTAGWAHADARAATLLPAWLDAHPGDVTAWTLWAEVARRRGDVAARTRALDRLVAIDGRDARTHATLARHLAELGTADAALTSYEAAVRASTPPDPAVVAEWATLLEQHGQFRTAIAAWQRLDAIGPASSDRLMREARLWRWAGEPAQALQAWARAAALTPDLSRDATVQADRARALADMGQWDAAAQALEVALAPGRVDADLLRVAATVETRRGAPGRAVGHLQALAALRVLTMEEQRWLAGQAEEARHYDVALEAWRQVPAARRDARYWRQVTWVAARVGPEAAMVAYAAAFAHGHADAAICLEAARLHAAAHQPADALRWYQRHLAAPGASAAGLEVELAQASMAAGASGDALAWARRARAAGPTDAAVTFLEAQALHMSGDPRQAAALLGSLVRTSRAPAPVLGDWLAWLGRTAHARGRLLEAYERYGQALQRGAGPAGELWLSRGDIAGTRGDLRRADANYGRAEALGQDNAAGRREALDLQRRPLLGVPAEVFWDTNDFRHASISGRLALRAADRARVTGEWSSGRVSQATTAFDRTAATLAVDRLFPTDRTTLAAQVGVEQARDATQPLWRIDGGYLHPGGQAVQVETFRESPWRADTWDARMRYNRITDLAAIPGDFHATGAKVSAVVPVSDHHELQGNAAVRHFSDGNRQVQGYLQYQLPLSNRQATWVAVQPYGYVEQWARPDASYFSPETQVTLGATVRAIVTRGTWVVDASVTPQYLDSAQRQGFGYAAVGSVRRDVGRASLGVTGMVFDDRKMGYRVQRVTLDLQVPVGR